MGVLHSSNDHTSKKDGFDRLGAKGCQLNLKTKTSTFLFYCITVGQYDGKIDHTSKKKWVLDFQSGQSHRQKNEQFNGKMDLLFKYSSTKRLNFINFVYL